MVLKNVSVQIQYKSDQFSFLGGKMPCKKTQKTQRKIRLDQPGPQAWWHMRSRNFALTRWVIGITWVSVQLCMCFFCVRVPNTIIIYKGSELVLQALIIWSESCTQARTLQIGTCVVMLVVCIWLPLHLLLHILLYIILIPKKNANPLPTASFFECLRSIHFFLFYLRFSSNN